MIEGRVVDESQEPVPGVWVNAEIIDGPAVPTLGQMADVLNRSALTDKEGKYVLDQLPAGDCLVTVGEQPSDWLQDRQTPHLLSNVFAHKRLKLKTDESPVSLEIRAVPQVLIEGQFYDSQGRPCSGHNPYLLGHIEDKELGDQNGYVAYGTIDSRGHFIVRGPKGLKKASLHLSTTEHCSLRVRMAKDQSLGNPFHEIDLATLERDIRGIEVVRYNAPILLVKAVRESGRRSRDSRCISNMRGNRRESHGNRFLRDDGKPAGDVTFARQHDGYLRSEGLLPDEEFTLTIEAQGHKPISEKFRLSEGAVKELMMRLKKS